MKHISKNASANVDLAKNERLAAIFRDLDERQEQAGYYSEAETVKDSAAKVRDLATIVYYFVAAAVMIAVTGMFSVLI